MIVSDDVSDGNDDDGMECDEDCAELWEGDLKSAEGAALDDDCCSELEANEISFHWKGRGKVG
jgi:hypothetical protein